ncbi:cuticle protein AMP1A isoform X2 [Hyalella azteca]|uniref:Cuticle protein AMP1A isoform X2 n=1 Tax=Hyalella azteca TaxID=294128 RepID=A0A8B7PFX1_HYAAZ|nr:cuticle protein AMP1A isoform X2 [Hyalella azteca]
MSNMKALLVFSVTLTAVMGLPKPFPSGGSASNSPAIAPQFPYNPLNYVRTKTDERVDGERGAYTFDIETENGISMSEAGQSDDSAESIVKAGSYSFTLPDGNLFELKYVADKNGFQPESSYLPVPVAFPHPIPQFVLDQIEKAAREDAEAARANA